MAEENIDYDKIIAAMRGKTVVLLEDNPWARKNIENIMASWGAITHRVSQRGKNINLPNEPIHICLADFYSTSCDPVRMAEMLREKNRDVCTIMTYPSDRGLPIEKPESVSATIPTYEMGTFRAKELLEILRPYLCA